MTYHTILHALIYGSAAALSLAQDHDALTSALELSAVSLLQTGTKRKLPGNRWNASGTKRLHVGTPSSSALGCVHVRSQLHARGLLQRAWTDACFQSVINFNVLPDEATIGRWMHSQCSCEGARMRATGADHSGASVSGSSLAYPDDQTVQVPLNPLLHTALIINNEVQRENYARASAIDLLLHDLLVETPNAQVVNLGAGFDGRFFALPSLKNASVLFELDHPDTQALKKSLVHNCNLESESSGGVRFLPLDLSADNVYDSLFNDSAFVAARPTLFISEAVFQYIPEEAAVKSLRVLANAMRQNEASRLILQSWTVSDRGPHLKGIINDTVNFAFPSSPSARKIWWAKIGLAVDQSVVSLRARQAFYQSYVRPEIFIPEYFDVLAPLADL